MSKLKVGDLIVCVISGGGRRGKSLPVGTKMRVDSFSSPSQFTAYSEKIGGGYGGNGVAGLDWNFTIINNRLVLNFQGKYDIFKKIEE